MSTTREEKILRELDQLKWEKGKFVCLKCGCKNSSSGEEPYSRRCTNSKCRRVVTLTKFTAFEGQKFPIEKAYDMLDYIVKYAVLGHDEKIISVTKRKKNTTSEEPDIESFVHDDKKTRMVTIREYIEPLSREALQSDSVNERLAKAIRDYQPSIGRMSKTFELEENTVIKFLDKIARRILPTSTYKAPSSLDLILDYLQYDDKTLLHMLGMAMVPLPTGWDHGFYQPDRKVIYGIMPKSRLDPAWAIYRIEGYKDKLDEYRFTFHEEIPYGSDEWYELFKEKKDA